MRVLKFAIAINLLGSFVFNLMGVLKEPLWRNGYYIWDKFAGCGLLMFIAAFSLMPVKERWVVRPVIIVATLRVLWVIIAILCGLDLNNQWWLALLFVCLSVSALYLSYQENSRANKWLSKNTPKIKFL